MAATQGEEEHIVFLSPFRTPGLFGVQWVTHGPFECVEPPNQERVLHGATTWNYLEQQCLGETSLKARPVDFFTHVPRHNWQR